MKKIFKIIAIVLGIVILLLFLSPFLFKGSLEELLKKNINKNLNASVTWETLDLSLFSNFPNAALAIEDFSIVNKAPFEGDTLARGQRLTINMGITQLFKSSNESILVDALVLEEATVNIKVDSLGNANYDIAIKNEPNETLYQEKNNSGFTFNLQQYEILNSTIHYLDEKTKTYLMLKEVSHEGEGDLSLDVLDLDTKTNALMSLTLDEIEYLNENFVSLNAVINLDLKNQKYTFLENEAKINELPLIFQGYIKVHENHNEIDLSFKTPSSDFKNFLAVIPKVYVKNIEDVTTTGNFNLEGNLKGRINDTTIPTIDIFVTSSNASFKYPDLPKTVQNIAIEARLLNETGVAEDTYLTVNRIAFKIDDELFTARGSLRNLTQNMAVDLNLNGTLNLANIEKVLPLALEQDLSGIFTADVTSQFDMNAIENEQYQQIKTNGNASLSDFSYTDESFNNPIEISNATISMLPGTITLDRLEAKTGKTDITATGTIQNLIPWVMAKEDLKGIFSVASNTFNINDFRSTKENVDNETSNTNTETETETIKIPDFLNARLNFEAKEIIYDNINLKNTKGAIVIANEQASLKNITSQLFGGNVAFSGDVNTQNNIPTFAMNLDLQQIDIDESFGKLSLLKYIAPIAKALDGDLNTQLNLSGELNKDLTPNLKTLAGNAIAQIITAEVLPEQTPLLTKIGQQIKFLNINKLSLRDVSTALDFNNGNIVVKPFTFDVKGIEVTAAGSHGLDKTIDYTLTMNVPARYLGGDVNKLLSKLDPSEADATTIALPVGLTGTLTNPNISVNTGAAVQKLTQQLIDKQKKDLKDKGKDILKDIITGGDTTPSKDSTSQEQNTTPQQTTKIVKDILGGIFGTKEKQQDTTKSGN